MQIINNLYFNFAFVSRINSRQKIMRALRIEVNDAVLAVAVVQIK